MKRIQSYLFRQVFRSVLIIVGGLTLLAILAQGLSQTDIIVENRQSALTYFTIVALGAPFLSAAASQRAAMPAPRKRSARFSSKARLAAASNRWRFMLTTLSSPRAPRLALSSRLIDSTTTSRSSKMTTSQASRHSRS